MSGNHNLEVTAVGWIFVIMIALTVGVTAGWMAEIYVDGLGPRTTMGIIGLATWVLCWLHQRSQTSSGNFWVLAGAFMIGLGVAGWTRHFFGDPYGTLAFLATVAAGGAWMSTMARRADDLLKEATAKLVLCLLVGGGIGLCVEKWVAGGFGVPSGGTAASILMAIVGVKVFLRKRKTDEGKDGKGG